MIERIRFTERELDVIIMMYCTAKAGAGDGDYQPWTDADWTALESLRDKVAILLERTRR